MSMVAFRTFGVEQNVSTDWFGSVAATHGPRTGPTDRSRHCHLCRRRGRLPAL